MKRASFLLGSLVLVAVARAPNVLGDQKSKTKVEPTILVSWKVDPSAPTTGTRCLFEFNKKDGYLDCTARGVGWSQELVLSMDHGVSGRAYGTYWSIGAEHAFAITLTEWGNGEFVSKIVGDPKFPITLKVAPDGYYYLCGRGTVTIIGGATLRLGYDIAEDDWIERLGSEHQLVREGAAESLGWLCAKKGAGALIKALEDPAWEVRRNAAEALGFVADPAAVPGLTKLEKDPNQKVRRVAAEAIHRIKDN